MLKRIIAVVSCAVLVSTLSAPAASAWAPPEGPTFNNPKGGYKAQFRLQLRVEKAIRNAPEGSAIYIATYLLDRAPAVDALVAARNRGVKVQVVLDGGINTGRAKRLKRVLNRDNGKKGMKYGPDRSFAMQCRGSCRGRGPNQAMHAKFYAFSRTGTAQHVVMTSSANLNRGGALLGYNDLFTMRNVPTTFRTYARVHREMAADRVDGNPYVEHREGRYITRVFPKRGAKRITDPTWLALDAVRCKGANGGAGRGGRTVVTVSMFHWGAGRGEYLARKLLALRRDGCRVNVLYGAPSKIVSQMLRTSAKSRGGITLYDSRQDRNGDGNVDLRSHHKYLLVNGHWNGDRSSWQVFTGSQNWSKGSLEGGDENTLKIASRAAYAKYLRNWRFVTTHGARRVR